MSEAQASRREERVSIGIVLERLRADFPDLTHSKLRFLEDQGLITPERTNSRYRLYSEEDIERVRLILTLQRDRFMPHKEIAKYLDAIDRGREPDGTGTLNPLAPGVSPHDATGQGALLGHSPVPVNSAGALPGIDGFARRPATRLKGPDLLAVADIDVAMLKALENFGLVRPRNGYYSADDLEIAMLARELATYGIEPRHLRLFRTAADREVSLVEQVTIPMRHSRQDGAAARAEDLARQISATCVQLHTALVRASLPHTR